MIEDRQDEKALFLAALEKHTSEERDSFLEEACAGNPELLQRLQHLLRSHDESQGPLDSPPFDGATTTYRPVSERPGEVVGSYKLLQHIGEGGMGVVYMAEQTEPIERRVALKIVKPGMDTRQVIARFEAERQALAMMDHPNIAKVLDAGTTSTGRPYFVMELVKGVPITEYSDRHRLTPRERLELFLPVCQAVQHAHQKGIIHRDIKPSNVLVAHYDDHPVPKIIDFGVAKAIDHRLTEKTMFTEFGQVLGTLEYMSPEQARLNQWDVDTRSDIYSLGVLLYELLSGETPFDPARLRSAAFDELLRIIREEEPPFPSLRLGSSASLPSIATNRRTEPQKLSALVHGELDWIVMKALEKDRSRRYESATGLRLDIQRYLQGDPVTAAPPSAAYRIMKFARRHRVAVVVSLLLTLAVLLAVIGTSIGMARAIVEKRRADDQAQLAEAERKKAEAAREEEEYSRYISDIPAANSFLMGHAPIHAGSILKNAPAKYRNFEWALLANRTWPQYRSTNDSIKQSAIANPTVGQFWGSGNAEILREIWPWNVEGGLYGGFFSTDGNSVFFFHGKGEIKRFSVARGEQQAVFSDGSDHSIGVALSPTGTKLAKFTFSNRPTIWDVKSEEKPTSGSVAPNKSSPWICRWTPDERFLVTGHMDGMIRVWSAESESLDMLFEWSGHQKNTMDVFFTPSSEGEWTTSDGVWTASNDGTVRRWSFPNGEPLGEFRIPVDGELEYQAISPSGKLAFAILRDGSHLLWEIETEKIFARLSGPNPDPYVGGPRFACDFSPDESCIAVMTGRMGVTIYDIASGKVVNEISGHGVPLRDVHFSPNGRMVLTVSEDGRARIWTCFPHNDIQLTSAHEDIIYQVDIDSTGTKLLAGSFDSNASVWNLRDNQREAFYTLHDAELVSVDFHPSDRRAATLDASGAIHVWNTETSAQNFVIDPQSDEFARNIQKAGGGLRANVLNFPAVLSTGIFTPDGSRIVAYQQEAMKVFNADDGRVETTLIDATSSGWPVYSYDSSLVAILELNSTSAGVWDIHTGRLLHRLQHGKLMVMLDFSPVDDRLATCAMGSEIIIWNARSGEKRLVLNDPAGGVMSCRFSRDGKYILAGHIDSTARVWDSQSGKLVTTLVGHSSHIRDVRFSPDRTRLLSWAMDDKAFIWDVAKPFANQILVLGGDSKLLQAHWTPDGRDIVTAWSDGSIKLWRGATYQDLQQFDSQEDSFEHDFDEFRTRHMNSTAESFTDLAQRAPRASVQASQN